MLDRLVRQFAEHSECKPRSDLKRCPMICSIFPPLMQDLRSPLPRSGVQILKLPQQCNARTNTHLNPGDILRLKYEAEVTGEPKTDIVQVRVPGLRLWTRHKE